MFVYNDAGHDSRVWKEAETLAASGRRVIIAGLQPGHLPAREMRGDVELIRFPAGTRAIPGTGPSGRWLAIRRARWLGSYALGLWAWANRAAAGLASAMSELSVVWHGHDLTGAAAAEVAQRSFGGRLIYDSHELFLDANTAARLRGIPSLALRRFEQRIIVKADGAITVNSHIADELASRYGVDPPAVVMNCPPLGDAPIGRLESPLRRELGLGVRPVVLFHGLVAEQRVATTLSALDLLPDEVAFVLLGQDAESTWVRRRIAAMRTGARVYTLPPVSIEELPHWVAGADVGVMAFLGTSLNQLFFTPNKLFECMNAGVPVVASHFPTMRDIVTPEIGRLCDPHDPRSIATAIRELLQEPSTAREKRRITCRLYAERRYNWEHEAQQLLGVYARLDGHEPSVVEVRP